MRNLFSKIIDVISFLSIMAFPIILIALIWGDDIFWMKVLLTHACLLLSLFFLILYFFPEKKEIEEFNKKYFPEKNS